MKRGFIRGVWGIYDNSHRLLARRQKIDADMKRILTCSFNEPFMTYVIGEDNYERIMNMGFKCTMIHREPYMFDLIKYQYRHKMEIIRYAMENDGYDEIVWLDWDCVPQKKLPDNFWEECGKRGVIQGCLQMYHKKKCHWRHLNQRKVINGGYLYIRDKSIPGKAIQCWDTIPQDNDEPGWSLLIDKTDDVFSVDNWHNTDICMQRFWNIYESFFCCLIKGSPYDSKLLSSKNTAFTHFI